MKPPIYDYSLNSVALSWVDTFKYPGVRIDSKLKCLSLGVQSREVSLQGSTISRDRDLEINGTVICKKPDWVVCNVIDVYQGPSVDPC